MSGSASAAALRSRVATSAVAPLRVPASGLPPLGQTPTKTLSEMPAIPGLEQRDDGSLVLNDGKTEWGLWRVADGIELARGGRAYIFMRMGSDSNDRTFYCYAEHADGGSSFTRSIDGRRGLHCTFGPAEINGLGDKSWMINGRLSRRDGPAIECADGTYEWRVNGRLHREGGEPAFFDGSTTCWYEKGQRHRIGGPAVEGADGSREWWLEGKPHREDGPAIERPEDGSYEWYRHGVRHREGGPASRRADGTLEWIVEGDRHRDDGPAFVSPSGEEVWFREGKIHNEHGPASIQPDGSTSYYLDDERVSHADWLRRTGRGARRASAVPRPPSSVGSAMNRR